MKLVLLILNCVLLIMSPLNASELHESGKCLIKEPTNMFDEGSIKSVTLRSDQIYVSCKLYSGKFVDTNALYAVPWITNIAKKPMAVFYHIAFLNKEDQLVAVVSQAGDIPADANGYQLGSCIIPLPKSIVATITSYKVVIYSSEKNGTAK